jgi:hypothetical protein
MKENEMNFMKSFYNFNLKSIYSFGYISGIFLERGSFGKKSMKIRIKNKTLSEIITNHLQNLEIKKIKMIENNLFISITIKFDNKLILEEIKKKFENEYFKKRNEDFIKGFLRGYFDIKGYVKIKKEKDEKRVRKRVIIRVASKSLENLRNVKNLLLSQGISSNISKSGKVFILEIKGKTRVQLFLKNIGFSLEEKTKIIKDSLIVV